MGRFDAFCGPFNSSISPNITSELTMNWIPEKNAVSVNDMGTGVTDKNVRCSLIRTPGLATFVDLEPHVPVRGLFPGENRLFAAGGDHFFEIFPTSYVDRSIPGFAGSTGIGPAGGTIGNDGQPVQAFANGNQILIVSAGRAYLDNGNGPAPLQFSDSLTDLLVDPAPLTGSPGYTLTTATGGFFDQSDVGRTVLITEGGGFNIGLSQVILSVDANGGAVGAAAWGAPGAGLGVGIEYTAKSYTDLQLITPSIVRSVSQPFGPSDIGTTLTITGGSGWIPGTYTITGLVYAGGGVPTGMVTITPDGGTAGASGGTGTLDEMPVTASQGAFLDGYFFIVPFPRTKTVYFSGINDGTSWSPLDFFVKTNYPDNIAALFADHQELYTMGNLQSTQAMRDVGAADNPFAPDPGAVMYKSGRPGYMRSPSSAWAMEWRGSGRMSRGEKATLTRLLAITQW